MCIVCNCPDDGVEFVSLYEKSRQVMKQSTDALLVCSKTAKNEQQRKRYDWVHKRMVELMREWNTLEQHRELSNGPFYHPPSKFSQIEELKDLLHKKENQLKKVTEITNRLSAWIANISNFVKLQKTYRGRGVDTVEIIAEDLDRVAKNVLNPSVVADARPKFDIGLDALPYAVFKDNSYSHDYLNIVGGFSIAHFGNYENAVQLQNTIGL